MGHVTFDTRSEQRFRPVPSHDVGDEPQPTTTTATLGPNAWLVDEMYEQYLADPSSVSESWREFFADYVSARSASSAAGNGAAAAVAAATATTTGSAATATPAPPAPASTLAPAAAPPASPA